MTLTNRGSWRRRDAERYDQLGLLDADGRFKAGDLDARTSREDFRAALDAVRTDRKGKR